MTAGAVLVFLAGWSGPAHAEAGQKPVLELFTSQGCSSCPPADALLGRYAQAARVITLSYSVDYWDSLGWHDTLGSAANSARQRAYAAARGDSQIYTPQMVVDGLDFAVGSDEAGIARAIRKAQAKRAGIAVPVLLRRQSGALLVQIGRAPDGSRVRHAGIWLISAKSQVRVAIGRGENAGRAITYHDAVLARRRIGVWAGRALRLRLDPSAFAKGSDRLVVVLQNGAGPILGAAEVSRSP